ncbi:hypothetical protein WN51_10902 [Melipona quadrifasciata]|uniref:Uncharacterized protein n=1 Tax=Melipona quadrifasciata TaxID=166423 RepID=A0A0M9A676_9HYME|nr:hypothetical protein WN51_10902 [Melipona quadrifasciata]
MGQNKEMKKEKKESKYDVDLNAVRKFLASYFPNIPQPEVGSNKTVLFADAIKNAKRSDRDRNLFIFERETRTTNEGKLPAQQPQKGRKPKWDYVVPFPSSAAACSPFYENELMPSRCMSKVDVELYANLRRPKLGSPESIEGGKRCLNNPCAPDQEIDDLWLQTGSEPPTHCIHTGGNTQRNNTRAGLNFSHSVNPDAKADPSSDIAGISKIKDTGEEMAFSAKRRGLDTFADQDFREETTVWTFEVHFMRRNGRTYSCKKDIPLGWSGGGGRQKLQKIPLTPGRRMEKPDENSTLFSIISRRLRDTVLYGRKKLMFTKDKTNEQVENLYATHCVVQRVSLWKDKFGKLSFLQTRIAKRLQFLESD